MTRGPSVPILRVLVLFALVCVLPACGLMGGNGDDEDDEKFPQPPDRPSSAHVVVPSADAAMDAGANGMLAVQIPPSS